MPSVEGKRAGPGALLRGVLLDRALEQLKEREAEIEDNLADYIRASQKHAEAEQRAQKRRQQWTLASLFVGLVVFMVLAVLAWVQRNEAVQQREIAEAARARAEEQRGIALGRQLAAQAVYMSRAPRGGTEALLAPLLAIESLRYVHSLEAYDVLQSALFDRLPIHTVIRHNASVHWATFSPDGRFLATAGLDCTAALVEIATGREIARIRHENIVWQVAFSSDGRSLVIAGDTEVLFFPLDQEELFVQVCARLPRNLTYSEWQRFFGNEPYHRTCPNLPLPPSTPSPAPTPASSPFVSPLPAPMDSPLIFVSPLATPPAPSALPSPSLSLWITRYDWVGLAVLLCLIVMLVTAGLRAARTRTTHSKRSKKNRQ